MEIWKKCYACSSEHDDIYEISNKGNVRVIPFSNGKGGQILKIYEKNGEKFVKLMDRYCLEKLGYYERSISELLEEIFSS
jgi:hypothetical protein